VNNQVHACFTVSPQQLRPDSLKTDDDAKGTQFASVLRALRHCSVRYRVYQAGTEGPVVFCLHGGGYSGLTWALLAKELKGR